jgi:hypothetical protein
MYDDKMTWAVRWVDAKEAQALRDGKAYKLNDGDLNRLSVAEWIDGRMWGDPDRDALCIKMLAKGWLVENPEWTAEMAGIANRIAELKATYGEGEYSIGVGEPSYRYIMTPEGLKVVRNLLAQYV